MAGIYEVRRMELHNRLPDDVRTAIFTAAPTFRYLTGYSYSQDAHGNDTPALLVVPEGSQALLLVPELESDRAKSTVGGDIEVWTYDGSFSAVKAAFSKLWSDHGTGDRVAVEYGSMRLLERSVLSAAGVDDLFDATALAYDVRSYKDDRELATLRRAASITDDVLQDTIKRIEPGMTESRIASILSKRVIDSEADDLGVSLVVSGPRTAQVYADTTDRTVESGDLVLVDTGVVFEGYYTDVTRTVVVGEASSDQRRMYRAVRDALDAVREAAAPGVSCSELDAIARRRIDRAGYRGEFVTPLGHGFGLEPHEPPFLRSGNEASIKIGHVFTIEPGVYRNSIGGIRIEDDVVMTEGGLEVLTDSPYALKW